MYLQIVNKNNISTFIGHITTFICQLPHLFVPHIGSIPEFHSISFLVNTSLTITSLYILSINLQISCIQNLSIISCPTIMNKWLFHGDICLMLFQIRSKCIYSSNYPSAIHPRSVIVIYRSTVCPASARWRCRLHTQ